MSATALMVAIENYKLATDIKLYDGSYSEYSARQKEAPQKWAMEQESIP